MSKKATNDNTLREIFPQAPTGDKELDSLFMGAYIATHKALKIALDAIHSGEDVAPVKDAIINRTGSDFVPLSLIETKNGSQVVAIGKQAELDPTNPAYDPQAYKEKLQALAPELEKAADKMSAYTREIVHNFADAMPEEMAELSQGLTANLPQMLANLTEWVKQNLQGVEWDLIPYITAEMEKPENAELLQKYKDPNEFYNTSEWAQIKQAAKDAQRQAESENFSSAAIKTHSVLQSRELALPFDIFNILQDNARGVNGQITMLPVAADHNIPVIDENGKKHYVKKELTSFYSVNFSDALPDEIARKLDYTDRLIYGAVDACLHTNGNIMTLPQIYKAMGYTHTGALTEKQKADIWHGLQKMNGAFIWYDFTEEQAEYKNSDYSNIGKPEAGESLLSFKAVKNVVINGQPTDAIMILDNQLPLYRAARNRGYHVEEVPIECLQLPGKMRRNNSNLAIIFFALEQISKAKKGKALEKILYSTLYEKCGLTENEKTASARVKRQRARDTLFDYLEHLKKIKYIAGYKEETTPSTGEAGVKIILADAKQ